MANPFPVRKSLLLYTLTLTLGNIVFEEEPGKPIFKFSNSTVIDTDTVFYSFGDTINVTCDIDSGIPLVDRTIISCYIKKTNSAFKTTSEGSRQILIKNATRYMDGAECNCWGVHISGHTMTVEIKFEILYPANVVTFFIGRRSTTVCLICRSFGTPTPLTTIIRHHRNGTMEPLKKSQGRITNINYEFDAGCLDNGAYECQSNNAFKGETFTDSKTIQVYVHCPPTSCLSEHDIPTFVRRPGDKIQITLCAFGYPAPNKTRFILYKDESGKQLSDIPRSKYNISLEREKRALKNVIITFNNFQNSDAHPYQLTYLKSTPYTLEESSLKFNLRAKGPPECPSNFTILDVGENFISLDLTPGHSYTMQQTLTVLRYSDPPYKTPMTSLAEFQIQGEELKTHKVSNLTPNTSYWLGVITRNLDGATTCLNDIINAITLPSYNEVLSDKDQIDGGDIGSTVTALVVIIVILVLTVIIIWTVALVVVNRRRKVIDTYRTRGDQEISRSHFSDDRNAVSYLEPRTQPTDEGIPDEGTSREQFSDDRHFYTYIDDLTEPNDEAISDNGTSREQFSDDRSAYLYSDARTEPTDEGILDNGKSQEQFSDDRDGYTYLVDRIEPTHEGILDQAITRKQFLYDRDGYAFLDPRTGTTDEVNIYLSFQNSGNDDHHAEADVYLNSPALKDNVITYSKYPPPSHTGTQME